MPIYEYRCGSCGEETEFLQKVDDRPKRKCPECGALRLKRLISAVGFRLKGGGWYETDFKSSDKKRNLHQGDDKPVEKKKDGDAKASGDKKGGGDTKSETKPTKSATKSTKKAAND